MAPYKQRREDLVGKPTFLATFALVVSLVFAPVALAQDTFEEQVEPEVLEEQFEDPQEPAEENVAEGQQEAAIEAEIEAQQGSDITPQQDAALESQAEVEGTEPESTEKAGQAKDKGKIKEIPKTGGPVLGSLLLPAGALLLGVGIVALAAVRRR